MKHHKTQAAIQQRRVDELLKQRKALVKACNLLMDANYGPDAGFRTKVYATSITCGVLRDIRNSKFASVGLTARMF